MGDQAKGLEPPEITTTVSPLPAVYCDRFSVGLTDRAILVTLSSPAPVGNQGAMVSVPAFMGALSHEDAHALANALHDVLNARVTLSADDSKRN